MSLLRVGADEMIFRRHIELEKGELDITPLIDVVFQLLIFFMLTSSFISTSGIRINLPGASSGKALTGQSVVISVDRKGSVTVDGKEMGAAALKARIKAAAKESSHILIRADKSAELGKVVEIWDLCREAGITNLNIATEQKDKGGAL